MNSSFTIHNKTHNTQIFHEKRFHLPHHRLLAHHTFSHSFHLQTKKYYVSLYLFLISKSRSRKFVNVNCSVHPQLTATHLVFQFENITSSKERFVSDTEPQRLVGLGKVELDSSSFAWIIREKVSCQADVQEIIADWFKQHLSCFTFIGKSFAFGKRLTEWSIAVARSAPRSKTKTTLRPF